MTPDVRAILERFRDGELLALVEDELAPADRTALLKRLADDPAAATLVERLIDDRVELRGTPAPVLPADFLAALEPRLARPMLIEDTPGSYRRRQRGPERRRRALRVAAAACLATAGAGAFAFAGWWALQSLDDRPAGVVALPPSPADSPVTPPAVIADRGTPANTSDDTAPVRTTPAPVAEPGQVAGPIPHGALVLVVQEEAGFESVEPMLAGCLQSITAESDERMVAFVRNFSFAEASRLLRDAAGSGPARTPDQITGLTELAGGEVPTARRREQIARRLHQLRVDRPDELASAHLFGARTLDPPYERQLEFSGRGATHTISVPVGLLPALLEELRLRSGVAATLRVFEDGPVRETAASPLAAWIEDLRRVQPLLDTLRQRDGAEVIELPVVIDHAASRSP